MSFDDMDAVELTLGKPVDQLSDTELVAYVKATLKTSHGLDLPTAPQRERSIMASLKRTYGSDAGRIVKWALQSGPVVYADFSKGCKWKQDKWIVEMQQHLQSEQRERVAAEGFGRLESL